MLAALLMLSFMLVQFASALHSTEHPFHVKDQSCSAFIAADKSKTDIAPNAICDCSFVLAHAELPVFLPIPATTEVRVYLSRAPPFADA